MKKMYIQPATELFEAQMAQSLCVSVINDPQHNMESEAPTRSTQGLKYLI